MIPDNLKMTLDTMVEEIIEEKETLFDGCTCERDFFESQAYFDAKVERYNKLYAIWESKQPKKDS